MFASIEFRVETLYSHARRKIFKLFRPTVNLKTNQANTGNAPSGRRAASG